MATIPSAIQQDPTGYNLNPALLDAFHLDIGNVNYDTNPIRVARGVTAYNRDQDSDATIGNGDKGGRHHAGFHRHDGDRLITTEAPKYQMKSGDSDLIIIDGGKSASGNARDNAMLGSEGKNTIDGGAGNDTIRGGGGDDRIDGDSGNDKLFGDDGDDRISGGSGHDQIWGGEGNDQIEGDSGDDTIYGGNGDDAVKGESGDDKLFGDAGNDTILGGSGHDTIIGGTGNDTLTGGAGDDLFVWQDGDGADTIVDFQAGDMLDLTGATGGIGESGSITVSQVGSVTILTIGDTDTITLQNVTDIHDDNNDGVWTIH